MKGVATEQLAGGMKFLWQIQPLLNCCRSFMILKESDFVSICDFLFYAQLSTANQTVMQLYKKVMGPFTTDVIKI